MSKTRIEWSNQTWNPIVGCSKVSPGCQNCYAERMAQRLAGMGQPNYLDVINYYDGRWNGEVAVCTQRHWDNIPKSGMCFVCSMGDLFHEKVPFQFLDEVYSEMISHPNTTFQVLTKRPDRALEYYRSCIADADEHDGLPCPIVNAPNIWMGATCENQEWADRRLRDLYEIDPVLRFASFEPLLGPVDLKFHLGLAPNHEDLRGLLGWIIVGCESGPGRRRCQLNWLRSIVQQGQAANIPVFVKQVDLNGKVVKDITKFPRDLRVREFPRETA